MPMIATTLQADLSRIFEKMNSMSEGGDEYMATETAKAIKTFILTGKVTTTDAGALPAGPYAGAGTGTITIDSGKLADDLLGTFTAGLSNDDLADGIASDIDNACKNGSVKTESSGTVTPPGGTPFSSSGNGEGKFTGAKTGLSATLKSCFKAMDGMASGGNEYFAGQFSVAVHSYMVAGSVTTTLKPPFVSGGGTGKVA